MMKCRSVRRCELSGKMMLEGTGSRSRDYRRRRSGGCGSTEVCGVRSTDECGVWMSAEGAELVREPWLQLMCCALAAGSWVALISERKVGTDWRKVGQACDQDQKRRGV